MLGWILSNPDTATAIAASVLGLFGIGKRALNLKDLKKRALARLRQEAFKLVHDPDVHAKARQALEAAADALLDTLGLKRTAAVNSLVESVIDEVLAELAEKLWDLHMAKLELELGKTAAALEAK